MDKGKKGGAAGRGGGAARGGRPPPAPGSGPGGEGAAAGGSGAGGGAAAGAGSQRGAGLAVRGGVSKKSRGGRGSGGAGAAAGDGQEDVDAGSSFTGWFSKDLRVMMYGFGDHGCPLDETVDLVEDITLEYLKEATLRAASLAADALKPKMDEKDLLFSVRKDPVKFARVKELLVMQQVIKEARNSFNKEVTAEDEEEERE